MEDEINEKLDFKTLKKDIAIKHGYNLSEDDPILMFVTLNDFMLNQYKIAFDDTLNDLSDTLINIKTDVNQYIKENEIELFKKIQLINNDNVSKVHNKIKEYFQQEAIMMEKYKEKQKNNNFLIISITIFNSLLIILLMLKTFNIM